VDLNEEAVIAFVIAGLIVLGGGSWMYRRAGHTARYPQGSKYGTWTSVHGGMRKPFNATAWFVGLCVAAVIIWLIFT
jgi:hypothetical protein